VKQIHDSLRERIVHPYGAATLLAIFYAVLSVAYVVTSTHVAAVSAQSVEHLERVERIKGILFVLGTAALFYVLALVLLIRVRRQHELLVLQRDSLVASEHRALAGLFAASVAHDINNVMMVARGNAELLAEPLAGGETKQKAADAMRRAFVELAELSQRLMTLGREGVHGTLSERDLVAVVDRAVQFARRHERVRRCTVTTILGTHMMLPMDEVLIDRMLLNLILNAADATRGFGRIEVRLTSDAESASIEVHDNGPGISDDVKHAIFEAFYTSKPDGLGLGLVSVKLCADAHHGSVEVFRSDLGGAAFRVRLPRVARET
jgi:two-component system sensor histidine kinase HydH